MARYGADWGALVNMRYSVRDANGDELFASNVWAHAAQYLRTWGGAGKVWDNCTDTVQLVQGDDDEEDER